MPSHDRLVPTQRETITTIPIEPETGLNILYTALADLGYDIELEEQPGNPNLLRVTSDPETKAKIEKIRGVINRPDGDLHDTIHALLEPWDGLIEEVSIALENPTSVSRVLSEAHQAPVGPTQTHNHLAELFVLAYEKGRFGEPNTSATYKKIPFDDEKAEAIKSRLKVVYDDLKGRSVSPISVWDTRSLLGRVIQDYLRPRPTLQPASNPTVARPQE